MKELSSTRLTTKSIASKLNVEGDIFMAGEPGGGEGFSAVPKAAVLEPRKMLRRMRVVRPIVVENQNSDEQEDGDKKLKQNRKLWAAKAWAYMDELEGRKINSDEQQSRQILIDSGIGPTGLMQADVVANSLLSNEQRIQQVEERSGRTLAPAQREKLIAAHEVGAIKDKDGKVVDCEEGLIPGTKAGIFNYTEKQLLKKVRLLEEAGITDPEERRLLIETGIIGFRIDPSGTRITNPQLITEVMVAEQLGNSSTGGANTEELKRALERVIRLPGGVPAAERNYAIARIKRVIRVEELKIKRDEGRNVAARIRESDADRSGQSRFTIRELYDDREKRSEAFGDLFAGLDFQAHKQFDAVFSPLTTSGARYERFMTVIREGSFNMSLPQTIRDQLAEDLLRYENEHRLREALHNINLVIYMPSVPANTLYDAINNFGSELGDLAWKDPGVKPMMDIYEAILRADMAEHGGYLRQEAVLGYTQKDSSTGKITLISNLGEVTAKTKDRFRSLVNAGQIVMRDERGNPIDIRVQYPGGIPDWQVDRIFAISRGMMIAEMRLISLAAESRFPKGKAPRYTSLFLQDILQTYSPYIHLLTKYGVGENGMAGLLHSGEEGKRLMGILGAWNPKKLEEVLKEFKDDPSKAFDSEIGRYLIRQNPNRAGDIFTWLSWRLMGDFDQVSIAQHFLERGRERMWRRTWWNLNHPGFPAGTPVPADNNPIWAGLVIPAVPDKTIFANDEYAKWIGTGLRFEKMRGELDRITREGVRRNASELVGLTRLTKTENDDMDKIKTKFDNGERLSSAEKKLKERYDREKLADALSLLGRMSDIQPHRLYLVSSRIRERIGNTHGLNPDQLETTLNNLSLVEMNMYRERENILNNGGSFDTVALDFNVIADPAERATAIAFSQRLQVDFANNKDLYLKEFVYQREATHGFVLWSGDAPVDEFSATMIGATAGFARRARDNKNSGESMEEEKKLLANLKNIKTIDEVVKALMPVYDKVAAFDAPKAKSDIEEKAEGIIRLFMTESAAQLPVYGLLRKAFGKTSVAQLVYGKGAPSWGPSEVRTFLIELKNKNLITEAGFKRLEKKSFATQPEMITDAGVTIAQLLMLAILLYMAQQTIKDAQKGNS